MQQSRREEKIRCLLIDDDADDREIFQMAVASVDLPVQFVAVADGFEGLKKICEVPGPDFVFLDLNMPHMDGKKCLEEIRKKPELVDLTVIIYSTSSYIDDIRETRRMGATGFITKPNNVKELVQILSRIFQHQYVFFSSAYYE